MLSRTSRYALLTLGYLQRRPGRLIPGEEIARGTGIPADYLVKVLGQLRKHGIVVARKGWGGGFALREGMRDRPIRDVLLAIEGHAALDRSACALRSGPCDAVRPCSLHGAWERIRDGYDELLDGTRIGDLAAPA